MEKKERNKQTNAEAKIEFDKFLKCSQCYKTITSATRYQIYILLQSTWGCFLGGKAARA
jgi:hypothetical protein